MNEDQFKREIQERWGDHERRRGKGRVWAGLFLLIIGGLLLLRTANLMFFPAWFFTWPVLVIALGLFSGIKHRFRGPLWIILIIIGSFSLADHIDPSLNMDRYNWPIILIAVGLVFILRPKRFHGGRWGRHRFGGPDQEPTPYAPDGAAAHTSDRGDFIDVTSVFGGIKKKRSDEELQRRRHCVLHGRFRD
jgi:hypothetical protein